MHTSVREVLISSEPDSSYFLRVDWKGRGLGSGFQLLLTDGQDAWRGEVSEAAVCAEAEELEMPTERYVQDLQQALTEPESSVTYSFSLTPSPPDRRSSAVTLAYEKVQKDISFRLGSVSLKAVAEPLEAVRQLLIHSLQKGDSLEDHNQRLQEENRRLRGEQRRIEADVRRYAAGKDALEAELYSRFVLVLNEKKAKIRSLQQTIADLQEERSSSRQKTEDSVKSDRTEDQEEDEYGGSTDEEPEEEQPPAASTPSAREASAASPLDGSLSDITDVAPSRKRRFRHLGASDAAAKKPSPQTTQRKRTDPPAGSSKLQTPQRSADAAAAAATSAVEDLFDDF